MDDEKTPETGPLKAESETSQLYRALARANQIASTTKLDDLLNQMLDLIITICGANAGTLYLFDRETDELIFEVVRGDAESQRLIGRRISSKTGIVGATIQQDEPLVIEDLANDHRWYRPLGENQRNILHNTISMPLLLGSEPIGAVQVFNYTQSPLQLMQLLGNRMASEIEKAILLQASERRGERLEALVSIIREISTTLDRDQILTMIMEKARVLLKAEASSLFLLDEETGDLILHIARDANETHLPEVRIPKGEGIIGYVVETGETALVNDADADKRHYGAVDLVSGKDTHDILAVPLIAPKVLLGQERGITEAKIIGGLEAMNKVDGVFTEADARILRTMADQAASVFHIANLYADANELFLDTIQSLVTAIDAKDPYTEGHSQRVSEFSIAIARQLEISQEDIHHIRIGSLLHDVGKIGIPDEILGKPARLTDDEFEEMKKHPSIGANIMGQVRMLKTEIPALEQHHERMDGKGYPHGLQDEEITLFGRIVAVADVFDALTSDRPYRDAMSSEEAMEILHKTAGTHLDRTCVDGLTQAYLKGEIKTQREREQLESQG
jgi:HD-GYP domain-containing protein (c-di-GMP phosphodiesterase class II)